MHISFLTLTKAFIFIALVIRACKNSIENLVNQGQQSKKRVTSYIRNIRRSALDKRALIFLLIRGNCLRGRDNGNERKGLKGFKETDQ